MPADANVLTEPRLFRFGWKWKRRSPSKLKESAQAAGRGVKRMRSSAGLAAPGESVVREFLQRTHEEVTKALHPRREGRILRRHLLEKQPISKLCDELCSILDGYSRYIVNWDIRESMTEADIEIILQGATDLPGSAAPDHLGQWAAVHRQRFQGVHSNLGHDPRPNLAVLPAIEREDRALAQIAQRGVHPARNAAIAR
jgi:hypothetical protein